MKEETKINRIYMDYAATTPVHPEVVREMLPYFSDYFGNPSSLHACGQEARNAVETAREKVAGFIGARVDEVIFTSGGTESDNFAITGVAFANASRGNHIITSAVEHHAVLETCHFLEKQGFKITRLPVDKFGMVDPDAVRKAITPKTLLVSIIHASNEIGTIQPIEEIGQITQEAGVYLHTDAVQSFAHIPVDVKKLNVDMLSVSGHKLYGPKGIGLLYLKQGTRIEPFMHGGGQESGRRGSTHNVPGIVGLAKAVEIAQSEMDEEAGRLSNYRDALIKGILERIEFTRLNGHPTRRLPNNVNVSMDFVEGEAILLNLDFLGICASTGSACSSESSEASHVLTAMGVPPEEARLSLRFSLGKWNNSEDVDRVLEVLPGIISNLRAMSPLYNATMKKLEKEKKTNRV